MRSRKVNGIYEMDAEKLIAPSQCRMARSAAQLSQRELAAAIGVSERTILGFEKGAEINRPTRIAIKAALEARGARFIEDDDGAVGVLAAA